MLKRLQNIYRTAAFIVLNTAILIVVGSTIYGAISLVKEYKLANADVPAVEIQPLVNPIYQKYGASTVNSVYRGMSGEEVDALLMETWSRPYSYEPYVQFRESPSTGKYVNIDEHGFRYVKNQGPWPPDPGKFNIFVFGGSTTFGYGVPDDQTIPSHLQEYIRKNADRDVNIYNFGRGYFFSTQERILYDSLLMSGIKPDLALFIDGLNDMGFFRNGEPYFTNILKDYFERNNQNNLVRRKALESVKSKSKVSFAEVVSRRITRYTSLFIEPAAPGPVNNQKKETTSLPEKAKVIDKSDIAQTVVKRYLQNKNIINGISEIYGIRTFFVWQPSPMYKYDVSYHPFATGYRKNSVLKIGYNQIAQLYAEGALGKNFLWGADIQKHKQEPLYVDNVHYTSEFSEEIANLIGKALIEKRMLIR